MPYAQHAICATCHMYNMLLPTVQHAIARRQMVYETHHNLVLLLYYSGRDVAYWMSLQA